MRTDGSFPLRVLSSAVFVPVVLWLIHVGGPFYTGYCVILLCVGQLEFHRLGRMALPVPVCALGVVAIGATVLKARQDLYPLGASAPLHAGIVGALAAAMFAATWILDIFRKRGLDPRRAAWAGAGMLYVGGLGLYLVRLRFVDAAGGPRGFSGEMGVALAYGMSWAVDIAAYAFGMLMGRTPLGPVSPRKTWEGSAGGMLAAVSLGAALGATVCPFLGPWRGAALGAAAGIAGQLGDLAESMLKRFAGAKDSGTFIPGHGGVLDRFDSLFLVAPVVYYFLIWNAAHP